MSKRIVVFSLKGGVGKTLIALNLAISLVKYQKQKVCLMDLDLQGVSDMARMLSLEPKRSAADLIEALKSQPSGLKKESFTVPSSFGIDFLSGTLKPQQSPHITTEGIEEVFKFLDQDYDFIVVDAGNTFSNTFLASLNQANLILLVVTPDILSLYQVKWVLETLQFFQFPLKMIKMILNRAESASSISWQEVSASFPVALIAKIPSEGKLVGAAVNRGIPVIIDSPKSKIARAIAEFSESLVKEEGLFIERQETDKIKFKEITLEKTGEFWQQQGLVEPLAETVATENLDGFTLLKRRIHSRLINELNLKRMDARVFNDPKMSKGLREKAEMLVTNLLTEETDVILSAKIRKALVKEVMDEALGLGPLEDLLADPSVTDIMVNNKDEIYVERNGRIVKTEKRFIANEQVKTIIERIIAPIGRRIDESVPMVDARLPDGSRVNAIIPPLALTGPALTIRKFKKGIFKVEDLMGLKTLNANMTDFIKACVVCRKNIIVSGGTGSGKTTVLNVLSSFIPANERIITLEDAAELRLNQEHWVRLESRPPNIEGKGSVSIKDLFRNTLRMRPDRIIIGECRGIETLDMLQAMNTGHDGSMTTIHANSTFDVLSRLDSMILMSGVELPIRAIREMIASAIDLIIHTARLSDGTRKIIQLTEITGMEDDLHIGLRDIFIFKQTGVDEKGNVLGDFQAGGYLPSFLEDIKIKGIPISEDIFKAPR